MEGHSLAPVACEQLCLSPLVLTSPGKMVVVLSLPCGQMDVWQCLTEGWAPLLASGVSSAMSRGSLYLWGG